MHVSLAPTVIKFKWHCSNFQQRYEIFPQDINPNIIPFFIYLKQIQAHIKGQRWNFTANTINFEPFLIQILFFEFIIFFHLLGVKGIMSSWTKWDIYILKLPTSALKQKWSELK